MTQFESQFKNTQLELDKKRQEHKHLLRPNLGHPHQVNQLTSLCEAETERNKEYMEVVEKQSATLQVRLKGMESLLRETILSELFLLVSEKGSTLKGNNLLSSLGSELFMFRVPLASKFFPVRVVQ